MALDSSIKAVGFDMDGTIMDTVVDYDKLTNVVADEFISLGVPMEVIGLDAKHQSMDESLKWLKANKPETLAGFSKRVGDRATRIEMANADIAKPFPGAMETVRALKEKGYKVGILTRGGHEYAHYILTKCGVIDEFCTVIARDDYPDNEAKPSAKSIEHLAEKMDVKPEEILYVGDGTVDWLTSVNSGCRFIGVLTGHTDEKAWKEKTDGNVELLPSVAELKDLI
ncbi:MAG: HAD family hydrolase [archaeon]|nr:HAD family hydrolase [archaeon]